MNQISPQDDKIKFSSISKPNCGVKHNFNNIIDMGRTLVRSSMGNQYISSLGT